MSRESLHSSRSEAALRQGRQPIPTWEAQYPDTLLLLEIPEEDAGEPLCGCLLATANDLDETAHSLSRKSPQVESLCED